MKRLFQNRRANQAQDNRPEIGLDDESYGERAFSLEQWESDFLQDPVINDDVDNNNHPPHRRNSRLVSIYDDELDPSRPEQGSFDVAGLVKRILPKRKNTTPDEPDTSPLPAYGEQSVGAEVADDFTDIPQAQALPVTPALDPAPSKRTSLKLPALPKFSFGRKTRRSLDYGDDASGQAAELSLATPTGAPEYDDETGWLVAQNLGKSFRGREVVRDVTLAVREGEAVGLLGPNGAGKTTVFYMITGLIRPNRGAIRIDGYGVTKLPMYSRSRLGIGYLPQEASIFRGLSVEDNIKAVLEIVEPNKAQRKEDLERLLEEFGITHLRKSPSIALSGGERRRCEIARALASRPAFMLLDEPFAGIDPIAVGDIQQLVQQLTARGIGVLITDHNVRETLGLIDRAYIIHSGTVLMEGSPADIVNNADVRRVYLGDQFSL